MSLDEYFITSCSKSDLMKFTELNKKGNVTINSVELFERFMDKFRKDHKILDILDGLAYVASSSAQLKFNKLPHTGSLNNCMGRWFELIFFKEFSKLIRYYNLENNAHSEIFKLPSATMNHKFYDLFVQPERDKLHKINPSTSNPDFIILKNQSQSRYLENLSLIERYKYKGYFGKLHMNEIDTIISIKTSARPDRRYQQVYEANLIKALFEKFNLSVKFISITLHEDKKNEAVYYSSSIVSIIRDDDNYKASIDNSIFLNEVSDVEDVFKYIFN